MGRLLGMLASLVAYFCVATLLALCACWLYFRSVGILSVEKLQQIAAVLQGVEEHKTKADENEGKEKDAEQLSFDEREETRDLQTRNLELREQALNSRAELIRVEQRELISDKERHERLKKAFQSQLTSMEEATTSEGYDKVRSILENINPKQAKEEILYMISENEINEVVALFSSVPIEKQTKIIAQFKTPEELVKIDQILRLIREGIPKTNLLEKTKEQLEK